MRVVVLASGFGSNLQTIIDRMNDGELSIEIAAVISDKPKAHALQRARRAGISTITIEPERFENRQTFDAELAKQIERINPNTIVLAGFMRILSEKFVNSFEWRVVNIHPSLLPKYKGLNTHKRVLQAGDRIHGATVHFVTAELDAGPIIFQKEIPVHPTDTPSELQNRVHECEHEIYPIVIQWMANGELSIENNVVMRKGQPCFSDSIQLPSKRNKWNE